MEPDWQALAEIQMELYRNQETLIRDLLQELEEVENDFTSPNQTWFTEDGIIFRVTQVEEEVLRREKRREWFKSSVDRIDKKVAFIEKCLSILTDEERELVIKRPKDYSQIPYYQVALRKFYKRFSRESEKERLKIIKQRELNSLRMNGLEDSLRAKKILKEYQNFGVV